MATDPDDEHDINDWIDAANRRGHGGAFARRDKASGQNLDALDLKENEREVLLEFAASMQAEFGVQLSELRVNLNDPPDCYATLGDRVLAIELTELVKAKLLARIARARSKHNPDPIAPDESAIHFSSGWGAFFKDGQWTEAEFVEQLTISLSKKNEKYRANGVFIDALVVHTDENWLSPVSVEEWLQHLTIPMPSNIRSVYFVMTYQAGYRKHWPVFRVCGDLR